MLIDQQRHLLGRKHRPPVHQHDVQTNREAGHATSAFDRISCSRGAHHETRTSQDAFPMAPFDGLVDLERGPEIVSIDD